MISKYLTKFFSASDDQSESDHTKYDAAFTSTITDDVHKRCIDLCNSLFDFSLQLVKVSCDKQIGSIMFTRPREVAEPNQFQKSVSPAMAWQEMRSYYRWRATATDKTLSVRASQNEIEFFVVPNQSVNFLSIAEFGSRLAGRLRLKSTAKGYVWLLDNDKATPETAEAFIKQRLSDLVSSVGADAVMNEKHDARIARLQATHNRTVDGLLLANQNLLFKLVNEQEVTKNEIARELHDTVLADLMMFRRYLSGDKELSQREMIEIVDDITKQVRDICNECTPKALQEWGLRVSLETLLQRLNQRTGAVCNFTWKGVVPSLEEVVELNTYRIFQECLNNVEKYARASKVTIDCAVTPDKLTIVLTDNGKGFSDNQNELREGGFGLRSMNQRADLIRCFHSCKLTVDSKVSKGTTVSLEMDLSNSR
ncbi:MAG TPA: ATP-binding protein [Oculatellaceae cyanobacterium]